MFEKACCARFWKTFFGLYSGPLTFRINRSENFNNTTLTEPVPMKYVEAVKAMKDR
jgi:hypothetical protein